MCKKRTFARRLNRRMILVLVALLAVWKGVFLGGCMIFAGEYPLQPVRWTEVDWKDSIWAERQRVCQTKTLPHVLGELERRGSWSGFQRLAGNSEVAYRAYLWADSDVYKTLEGMAYVLHREAPPSLAQQAEQIIGWIVQAQAADGYLMPHLQLQEPQYEHFSEELSRTCESYSMGHLIESAVAYHQATGRTEFLQSARKAADLLDRVHREGKHLPVSGHPEVEIALVRLAQATGEQKYLSLAQSLVANARKVKTHWSGDRPFLADTEPWGHAVASCYLWAGATDVAVLCQDQPLLEQLQAKWRHMVERKMYITGGIGQPAGEAFGPDYHLPNYGAYCETCAAIATVFWTHRLFLATADARYMDVVERILYNAFLAGVHAQGDQFFYVNPLASQGQHHRQRWHGCACCPTNVVRFLPMVGQYAYATAGQTIYVCLYGASGATLKLEGKPVQILQKTQYPWEGKVTLQLEPKEAQEFTLALRVPGYLGPEALPGRLYSYDKPFPSEQSEVNSPQTPVSSKEAGEPKRPACPMVVKVNGEIASTDCLDGGFLKLRRQWHPGDVVELEIPMSVRRIYADRRVETNRGRVALQRGPIVYCVEATDHQGRVSNLLLPPEANVQAEHRSDFLGGITVLHGTGQRLCGDGSLVPTELTAIPYCLWDHRQAGEMLVWLAETPEARGPVQTRGWVGSNYTPAYCVNQVQMWHDFRPEVVDRELGAARRYFGLTTLRVFLHNINYEEEKERFLENIERFLEICQRHGIRPGFVFFDDCHRQEGIYLDRPTEPVKGYHNGRWAACPQQRHRTEDHLATLQAYVQDVIRAYREDRRVLWWEIFNEPNMKSDYSVRLRELAYRWAKQVEPIQPILSCWDDNPQTEIVDAHKYWGIGASWDQQAEQNPDKGAVFTEAGARWYAPRPSSGEPCEVIHWLRQREATGRYVPGVYLCWELMVGNSNCRWYWGTAEGTPEPTVPWCGLLWPDSTPVSLAEAEAIHRWTTGQTRALFFDDFQETLFPHQAAKDRAGWTLYGPRTGSGSRVMRLEPGQKLIAGDPRWTDYVLEALVMLHEPEGNAGLVFRVNDPGDDPDQMRGYYVGFDTRQLYLGKMQNRWQELAQFDLGKLDCRVVPGVWNQIRVAVQGPKIRVWFNRMHPSADPQSGLRLELTDPTEPVLHGAVGLRSFRTAASFDNVVVLPVEALPEPVQSK